MSPYPVCSVYSGHRSERERESLATPPHHEWGGDSALLRGLVGEPQGRGAEQNRRGAFLELIYQLDSHYKSFIIEKSSSKFCSRRSIMQAKRGKLGQITTSAAGKKDEDTKVKNVCLECSEKDIESGLR